ncbi:hypothetical protein EVAR_97378_1 [Eumeta japonica]|uniref:Uncharacterized protein n=1 Tax=Eumeta variegata TaxID=151549 RepID=A0A4C1YZE9_EUMVA|nr:hypothetical protein EVAR_97378_1 [Eumeta japonica]
MRISKLNRAELGMETTTGLPQSTAHDHITDNDGPTSSFVGFCVKSSLSLDSKPGPALDSIHGLLLVLIQCSLSRSRPHSLRRPRPVLEAGPGFILDRDRDTALFYRPFPLTIPITVALSDECVILCDTRGSWRPRDSKDVHMVRSLHIYFALLKSINFFTHHTALDHTLSRDCPFQTLYCRDEDSSVERPCREGHARAAGGQKTDSSHVILLQTTLLSNIIAPKSILI